MSRITRSTVAGIALTLTLLGATAAAARPPHRDAGSRPAPAGPVGPAGITERVTSWWTDLAGRLLPSGRGGLTALSGRAGSQMDPNGGISEAVPQRTSASILRSPGL
jgi:hypothetical protein